VPVSVGEGAGTDVEAGAGGRPPLIWKTRTPLGGGEHTPLTISLSKEKIGGAHTPKFVFTRQFSLHPSFPTR